MSARARVITYSGYNNLIYTIRSSIRNQSHISHSRTQQKELMSFLQSTIYLLFSILVTYVRLFWCRIHFFSHILSSSSSAWKIPNINKVDYVCGEFGLHMKESPRVLGLLIWDYTLEKKRNQDYKVFQSNNVCFIGISISISYLFEMFRGVLMIKYLC